MAKGDLACRSSGFISGLLLAVPHLVPFLAPVQLVALLPVLMFAMADKSRGRAGLVAGGYMGLAYTVPQVIVVKMPAFTGTMLVIYFTVLMAGFVWALTHLLRGPTLPGALVAGAMLVLLDWTNFTLVPIWGTAQSIVRPWSYFPPLILFVSMTGITGISFILGAVQALIAGAILDPSRRKRFVVAMIVVVAPFAAANFSIAKRQPTGSLTVAAIGWTLEDCSRYTSVESGQGFDDLFARPVAMAAREGARLVVAPEMAFVMADRDREDFIGRLGDVAAFNDVFLVTGYFNPDANENRILLVAPDGALPGEYTKTHLIPGARYNPGDGRPVFIKVDGLRVGGMICQDDNFTDLSRAYGRAGTAIVAVPTNDWPAVRNAHLQGSIHRALESRYGVVRAGLAAAYSAVITADGEILGLADHSEVGPGAVVADLPVYSDRTLFSLLGHWPVVPCSLFVLAYTALKTAQPRPDVNTAKPDGA